MCKTRRNCLGTVGSAARHLLRRMHAIEFNGAFYSLKLLDPANSRNSVRLQLTAPLLPILFYLHFMHCSFTAGSNGVVACREVSWLEFLKKNCRKLDTYLRSDKLSSPLLSLFTENKIETKSKISFGW